MNVRVMALLALALLASAPAEAKRKHPLPATTRSDGARTVGDLAHAGAQAIEVKPDSSVAGGAERAMENYSAFLKLQNTDDKLRAEALRRLGDLRLDSGELDRMASEVSAIDVAGGEAIRLYTTLLKAYPEYARNDQVLYQLARAYETTGQVDTALATLERIVRDYPAAREIAEVHFRRGELLFSAKRYADAQGAYEQVISRGATGSTFYDQSLYKHGWSLFKESQYDACQLSFMKLLDRTLIDRRNGHPRSFEQLTRPERELAEDTLRVMGIAFSYQDGAKSIDQLLASRRSTPYAWLLYARLGDLYVQKQRFQDAATTYRAFVARDPVDEHAPGLSNLAIDAYAKGGFSDLVVEGKAEYVRSYGFAAPFWKSRQRTAFPQVVAELKTNYKDLAQYYHAQAQKSKSLADYRTAAGWYRDLLAAFPQDADSESSNYLLAEALFESHQYLDAATEYEHTAYGYALGERSATAGYAALVALQKQEDSLPAAERASVHARAVESGVRFAQAFPAHPESAGVLTRAAQDVFAAHDLPRAATLAQALLARSPPVDASKQRIAWNIIGEAHFEQQAYDQAEPAFQHALAAAAPGSSEYTALQERLAASVYRQGEAKRAAGDDAGAALDFLRVAAAAPASKVVPTARYDAAAAYINAKQWDHAIQVLEAYRRDYPKTEYAADITRKLAVAYVEAGKGGAAAAEFERIAASPGEDPALAREATLRAADLYEQSGNVARTTAMLEQFVQKFPQPVADAVEARARLAAMAQKAGDAPKLAYWRAEIVKADATAGPMRTDRTRFLAATAKLALAEPARDAFRAVQLSSPLKKSLVKKKEAMEAALGNYKAIVAYDIAATTTAATYEMAELYRTLAHDLLASERPKKLSSDEREQYDSLLEEQAFPFEEQAIQIHEINARRTVDGYYDEPVRHSFQVLAQLSPARYGKTEQWLDLKRSLAVPAGTAADPRAVAGLARGVAAALDGKATDAALEFQQLELQFPQYAEASINYGLVAQGAGQLDIAAAAMERATQRAAQDPAAWTGLALVRRAQGRFTDARAAYQQALAADPAYAPAQRNLAVLLDLYLNDPAAALDAMERYHQLVGGDDKQLNGWLAELRRRAGPRAAPAAGDAAPAPAASPAATEGQK
jgi:TolA-binding protein